MKPFKISIFFIASILITSFSFAQQTLTTQTIKVWGNCASCKKHIEKAAKSAGAVTANWNEDSKQLKMSYDSSKATSLSIQQAIANAGYDTQDLSADNIAYKKLDACCQYDKKKAIKKQP